MATSKPKVPGNRDKVGSFGSSATLAAPGLPPPMPVIAEDEHYPGERFGMTLWVSAVLVLAGYLLWDLVTALLFR